jgi:hypothetical protein
LEEFAILIEKGAFDGIRRIFKEIKTQLAEDAFISLNISASYNTDDTFFKELLEEYVFIIHNIGEEITIGCQQNERKKVLVQYGDGICPLIIPFDKVEMFAKAMAPDQAQELEVDENYYFVAMSFEKDPSLLDTFEAIERSVQRYNPKATIDRVDRIPGAYDVPDKIIECIRKANVVIADLTRERPNVYYELGYARGMGKRVIHTAKEGTELHFDVHSIHTILWGRLGELEKGVYETLATMLKKA